MGRGRAGKSTWIYLAYSFKTIITYLVKNNPKEFNSWKTKILNHTNITLFFLHILWDEKCRVELNSNNSKYICWGYVRILKQNYDFIKANPIGHEKTKTLLCLWNLLGTQRILIALQQNLTFCYIFKEKLTSQRGPYFDGQKRRKSTNGNNVQQYNYSTQNDWKGKQKDFKELSESWKSNYNPTENTFWMPSLILHKIVFLLYFCFL